MAKVNKDDIKNLQQYKEEFNQLKQASASWGDTLEKRMQKNPSSVTNGGEGDY